jgi:uncharacterized protein
MLLKRLIASFVDDASTTDIRSALVRFLRSLRSLWFPARSTELLGVLAVRGADLELRTGESFFHLQQRHYLSRHLTPRQRIDSLLHHQAYESRHYLPGFRREVYANGGLTLWQRSVGGTDFAIRLTRGNDNRIEGELSAVLYVNGSRLSVMSFSYVDARIFGLAPGPIIFITRNQSGREAAQQGLFRSAFKQTTPPYFCLAALSGIAAANGMHRIAAIRHDAHIAYERDVATSLRNSYDVFWASFQAVPLDRQAFLMPVPLGLLPLDAVPAKHRKRATARRQAWAEVSASAAESVSAHQRAGIRVSHCMVSAYLLLAPLMGV